MYIRLSPISVDVLPSVLRVGISSWKAPLSFLFCVFGEGAMDWQSWKARLPAILVCQAGQIDMTYFFYVCYQFSPELNRRCNRNLHCTPAEANMTVATRSQAESIIGMAIQRTHCYTYMT